MRHLFVLVAFAACGNSAADGDDAPVPDAPIETDAPAARDTTTPFPIDGSALAGAPATYKGLSLQLTDTGAPTITPVRGIVGVVCVGMSKATQECSDYISKLQTMFAGQIDTQVRVVDCAVGGHAIERWNDPAYDSTLWDACLTQKIVARNLAPDQIRVIYHKAADQFTVD